VEGATVDQLVQGYRETLIKYKKFSELKMFSFLACNN